jgi:chromosome segregation ATPase
MAGESSAASGTADHKLALEVEKLQIEVAALRKPRRWSLTTLFTGLTVAATLIGTGFQYKFNQIKAEQTALDLARLEARHNEVQQLLSAAIANLESTTRAQAAAKERLDQIEQQMRQAESQLASLAPGPQSAAARAALGEARASLGAVSASVQRSSNSVEADITRLQSLQQGIRGATVVRLSGVKVGIYFLADNAAGRTRAEQIRDALTNVAGSVELYPRDRAFFETVNLPSGDEVRYEAGREDEIARELAATLERLTARRFSLRTVGTPTPNFVSVMIAEGL